MATHTNEQLSSELAGTLERRPLLRRALDFIFGYDFFISYSWRDGATYANALARRLEADGFEVFLDRNDYATGDDWKKVGAWTLRRTGQLLLVGSPGALESLPVTREVEIFSKTGRRIIPIDIAGSLNFKNSDSTFASILREEILRIREPVTALDFGPSHETIVTIHRTFNLVRQDKKRIVVIATVALLLGVLAIVATGAWLEASAERDRTKQALQVALKRESQFLSRKARDEVRAGKAGTALQSALKGLPVEKERPWVSETFGALIEGVNEHRERRMFIGHEASIHEATFSPDGTRVVTASSDKTARLWDVATGHLVATLHGHGDAIGSAVYSPDGSRILTTEDNMARIWDAVTGSKLIVLRGHEKAVASAAFSYDGARVVTTSPDKTARLWDAVTGRQIALLRGHEGDVTIGLFSRDSARVLTASGDKTVRVWNAVTGRHIAVLLGHEAAVTSAAFNVDGTRILTASADRTARLWDVSTRRQIAALQHEDAVSSAVFSPDNTRILTASRDKTARLWDVSTGRQISILGGHPGNVNSAFFSPDGTRVLTSSHATASDDGTARLWDIATESEIAILHDGNGASSAIFSPDGRVVLTVSGNTARLWDVVGEHLTVVLRGHKREVTSAVFSTKGTRIVTASEDTSARLWDAGTGRELMRLYEYNEVDSATFSPDGKQILTASRGDLTLWDVTTGRKAPLVFDVEDFAVSAAFTVNGIRTLTISMEKIGVARLWDERGQEISVLRGHEDSVNSMAFSPNGERVVTTSDDKTARLWDVATGREIAVLRGHKSAVRAAVFSPDGARVVTVCGDKTTGTSTGEPPDASTDDKTARVWDATTGREIAVLQGHEGAVIVAAFSPDSKRLLTTTRDKTAHLWNAATGRLVTILRGHEDSVNSAAFSPDSARVATASDDATLRLWNAVTGEEIAVLRGHEGGVTNVAFNSDGERLLTTSRDMTARNWWIGRTIPEVLKKAHEISRGK